MTETTLHVGILVLDGFQLSSLATLTDTLRAGENELPDGAVKTILMTPTGQPARSACGLELPIAHSSVWPDAFDYLIVLGSITGRLWRWSSNVSRYLWTAEKLGVVLVGLESGVETLARLKFLEGYSACLAAGALRPLAEAYPNIAFSGDAIIVHDRNRITARGGVVGSDLAAYLIEKHFAAFDARAAAAMLMREGPRPPHTTPPVAWTPKRYSHPKVRLVVMMMTAALDAPRPVEKLAEALAISRRQLDRLCLEETGMTAKSLYLTVRLDEARRLLAQSQHTVSEIAYVTGFTDAAHLNLTLRKRYGRHARLLRRGTDDKA